MDYYITILCVTVAGVSYQVAVLTGIVRGRGDTAFVLVNGIVFMWLIVLRYAVRRRLYFIYSPPAVFICLNPTEFCNALWPWPR